MPVTPEEWDSGKARTQLASVMLSFLRENSPAGYSVAELMEQMPAIGHVRDFHPKNLTVSDVTLTLDGLVADGELESKDLLDGDSKETYYRTAN